MGFKQAPETLGSGARELWGARLISCAGSVYEQALRQRLLFRNNERCDDPPPQGGADLDMGKQREDAPPPVTDAALRAFASYLGEPAATTHP